MPLMSCWTKYSMRPPRFPNPVEVLTGGGCTGNAAAAVYMPWKRWSHRYSSPREAVLGLAPRIRAQRAAKARRAELTTDVVNYRAGLRSIPDRTPPRPARNPAACGRPPGSRVGVRLDLLTTIQRRVVS